MKKNIKDQKRSYHRSSHPVRETETDAAAMPAAVEMPRDERGLWRQDAAGIAHPVEAAARSARSRVPVDPPVSGIVAATGQLANLRSTLHDKLGELEKRLGYVLRPAPPSPPTGATETPLTSGLAADLEKTVLLLGGAVIRIVDITNRLDL